MARRTSDFELLLIAGSGWGEDIPARIADLQPRADPSRVRTYVSDAELADAYQAARFSVLVSLHEGYGLPVAESLGYGTPVITTNYGSTRPDRRRRRRHPHRPPRRRRPHHAMRRLLPTTTASTPSATNPHPPHPHLGPLRPRTLAPPRPTRTPLPPKPFG